MNPSLRSVLLLVPLFLQSPAAANTVFEISPDTVYEGKWPDTAVLTNLSSDTIELDSIFVLLDTSRYVCCNLNFCMSEVLRLYGVGTLLEPVRLNTDLWMLPGGPMRVPGGQEVDLFLWMYFPCGTQPMAPDPVPDTIGVTLVFAIDGERDTLVVLREAAGAAVRPPVAQADKDLFGVGQGMTLSGRRKGAFTFGARGASGTEIRRVGDGAKRHVDISGGGGNHE